MYGIVVFSIIGYHSVLFVTLFCKFVLCVLKFVLLVLGNFFWLFLTLFLSQSSFARLQTFNFATYRLQFFGSRSIAFVQNLLNNGVVRVKYNGVSVGHLCIETHTLLVLAHLFHTAHILVLCSHNRLSGFAKWFYVHHKFCFFHLRHLRLERLS